jgi:hypothetical protein
MTFLGRWSLAVYRKVSVITWFLSILFVWALISDPIGMDTILISISVLSMAITTTLVIRSMKSTNIKLLVVSFICNIVLVILSMLWFGYGMIEAEDIQGLIVLGLVLSPFIILTVTMQYILFKRIKYPEVI